jgi:hypothetical protein
MAVPKKEKDRIEELVDPQLLGKVAQPSTIIG